MGGGGGGGGFQIRRLKLKKGGNSLALPPLKGRQRQTRAVRGGKPWELVRARWGLTASCEQEWRPVVSVIFVRF